MKRSRQLAVLMMGAMLMMGLGLAGAFAADYQFPVTVRVNNDGINQNYHYIWSSGMRNIALHQSTVYAVWTDYRDGYPAVYLGTSVDDGNSFAANIKVNDDLSYAAHLYPTLAVDQQGTAYVAWMDGRTGIYGVFFAKVGAGYYPNIGVAIPANADDWAGYPTLAVAPAGDKIFLAWQELDAGQSYIKFSCSQNGGISFDKALLVDSGYYPAVASGAGGEIYLAWMDWDAAASTWVIKTAKSTNGGKSFSSPIKVNPFAGSSSMQLYPALAADANGGVFVSWTQWQGSNSNIYLAGSTDGAASFYSPVAVSSAPAGTTHDAPSVATDTAGNIYVAWGDNRTGNSQVYMARSTNGGQSFGSNQMVSQSQGYSSYLPSLAADDKGNVYTLWAGADLQTYIPEIYFGYGYNLQNLQNPPETSILTQIGTFVNTSQLMVSYVGQSGNMRNLTYSYALDKGAWSSWTSPTSVTLSNLAQGGHTLKIRSRDGIGQIDPTPAETGFIVDTIAPSLTMSEVVLKYNRLNILNGISFSGSASDKISGLDKGCFRLVSGQGQVLAQGSLNFYTAKNFSQTLLLNNLSSGITQIQLIVTVKDKAGNQSQYTSVPLSVNKANSKTISRYRR